MAEGDAKEVLGRTFPSAQLARQHALALVQQGMKARVIGPVKTGFIVGPSNQPLPWPNPSPDQWLVLGTDATIETPPGSPG